MEDFLREYVKCIVQGLTPSIEDTMKLYKDMKIFIKMDMNKYNEQRKLLNIECKKRNPKIVYNEQLGKDIVVYEPALYILSEEEEKQSNNIKLLISIVTQETYNYLKVVSNNQEVLKDYRDKYVKYTNMIKSLFDHVVEQIQVIYDEKDYLFLFNQDANFIEYMKKNIHMGDTKDGVFIYTYNCSNRYPEVYFNLLWKYFIEDKSC